LGVVEDMVLEGFAMSLFTKMVV